MELVKQSGSMLAEFGAAFGASNNENSAANNEGCSISEITSGNYYFN